MSVACGICFTCQVCVRCEGLCETCQSGISPQQQPQPAQPATLQPPQPQLLQPIQPLPQALPQPVQPPMFQPLQVQVNPFQLISTKIDELSRKIDWLISFVQQLSTQLKKVERSNELRREDK